MKTTKCTECGAEIPLNYIVCPHCKGRCRSNRFRQKAMIFAFCLGFVGVHNFYMGFLGKGILEACVFTLSLVFLIVGLATNTVFLTAFGIVIMLCSFADAITEGVFLYTKKWSRDHFGKKLLEQPKQEKEQAKLKRA